MKTATAEMVRRFASVIAPICVCALAAAAVPGPPVARLSLAQGGVRVFSSGSGQWVAAERNLPLVRNDELVTGSRDRAEVEFDAVSVLRIAPSSRVKISDLSGHQLGIQLLSGALTFTVRGRSSLLSEIDTPNMCVRPLSDGEFRVEVFDRMHTRATSLSSRAEVWTDEGKVEVRSHFMANVEGERAAYQLEKLRHRLLWDEWVHNRESATSPAASARFSGGVAGTADLDAYGRWVQLADYGMAWTPVVRPGWAPYVFGRWTWTRYYGWTWLSREAWGWAPYHYGRWLYDRQYGWCWWPGESDGPRVWAPAYVRFYVADRSLAQAAGLDSAAVGWVALAPHEGYTGYSQNHYMNALALPSNDDEDDDFKGVNLAAPTGVLVVADSALRLADLSRFIHLVHTSRENELRWLTSFAPMVPVNASTRLQAASGRSAPRVYSRHRVALLAGDQLHAGDLETTITRMRRRIGLPAEANLDEVLSTREQPAADRSMVVRDLDALSDQWGAAGVQMLPPAASAPTPVRKKRFGLIG